MIGTGKRLVTSSDISTNESVWAGLRLLQLLHEQEQKPRNVEKKNIFG